MDSGILIFLSELNIKRRPLQSVFFPRSSDRAAAFLPAASKVTACYHLSDVRLFCYTTRLCSFRYLNRSPPS